MVIKNFTKMQGMIWGFTYVFTLCVKHPDDQDQYRTGYNVTQVNRIYFANTECLAVMIFWQYSRNLIENDEKRFL